MASPKYGILFCIIGVLSIFLGSFYGGAAWILLWPAANFFVVAAGYLGMGPAVFGKRSDGRLALVHHSFLVPFLVYTLAAWHLIRLTSREPPTDRLVDGIWLGRRQLGNELPSSIDSVLDLTAEFPEPRGIRDVPSYLCSPIMDAGVPTWSQLHSILSFLHEERHGGILIHCAQGHGRTATVAAAFLIASGRCNTVEAAIEHTTKCRPKAHMNKQQRRFLDTHQSQLVALATQFKS